MSKSSKVKSEYNCYVELALDVVGGKWKPIIIYYIGVNKIIRFNQLNKSIPSINERMLARQLKELVNDKVVKRIDYKTIPPKVEYCLLPFGEKLMPIIEALKSWSFEYNSIFKKADFAMENGQECIVEKKIIKKSEVK